MTSNKLVDVIIPSYKDLRIFRTIQSLKASAFYENLRLIIIDGGSDNPLIDQIEELIRPSDVLISEPDKGIFDALNKGLNNCTSEFIYWLGSDDFINPEFDWYSAIDHFKDDQVVGIVGKTYYFDQHGVTRPLFYNNYTLSSYKYGSHIPHFSSIWRRDFIGELRFDLDYWISADYDFFFVLIKKLQGRIVFGLDELLVYMQEGGNSSKNVRRQLEGVQQLRSIHQKHTSYFGGIFFVFARYFLKIKMKIRFKLTGKAPIIEHLSKIGLQK